MNEYMETIQKAINEVKQLAYTDSMQTETITVECEYSYLKVNRKCSSLTHSEIMWFKVLPKYGMEHIKYEHISKEIKDALDLYGDISIDFQEDNVAVIGV